jgi:hypothetical protein
MLAMTDKSAAAIRELVERWMGKKHPITMQSYVSDLTALISEHYYPKEKYDELLQQRDELKEALISLMWQFAYYGTKNNVAVMHTGGLSALEDAFSALGLSDPITVENFEAAIKNTKDETDTIQR